MRAGRTPGALLVLAGLAVLVLVLVLVLLGVTAGEVVATVLFVPVFAAGLFAGRKAGYAAAAVATVAYLGVRAGDLSGAGVASAGVMVLTRAAAFAVAGHVGALVRVYVDPSAFAGDGAPRPAAGRDGRDAAGMPSAVEWQTMHEVPDPWASPGERTEPVLAAVGASGDAASFGAEEAGYGDGPMTMSGAWPPDPPSEHAAEPATDPGSPREPQPRGGSHAPEAPPPGGGRWGDPRAAALDDWDRPVGAWQDDTAPPDDTLWGRPDEQAPPSDPWGVPPANGRGAPPPDPWGPVTDNGRGAPPSDDSVWGRPDEQAPPSDPWGVPPANGRGAPPADPWDPAPGNGRGGPPSDPWGVPPANGRGAPPDPWGSPQEDDLGGPPPDPWGAPPGPDPATQPPGPSPWSGLSSDAWSTGPVPTQQAWDDPAAGKTAPVDGPWGTPSGEQAPGGWAPPVGPVQTGPEAWAPPTGPVDEPGGGWPPPPAGPDVGWSDPSAPGAPPAPAPGFGRPAGYGAPAPAPAPEPAPRLPAVDPETGLWTAQFLRDRLSAERARSRRSGHPCSLVLVQVPDGPLAQLPYRRQVTLLRELGYQFVAGGVVDHMVHVPDQQQHWFAVILPDTDRTGAQVLERRLRLGIGGYLASRGLPLRDLQSASLTSPDDDEAMGQIWDALIGPDAGG
jgi:hypothetical protein